MAYLSSGVYHINGQPDRILPLKVDPTGILLVSFAEALELNSTPAQPSSFNYVNAAGAPTVVVKASAGTLYNVVCANTTSTNAHLKLYDRDTAPVIGTTPVTMVIAIPQNSHISVPFGALGHRFSSGISIGLSTGILDSNATSLSAGQVKLMMSYI